MRDRPGEYAWKTAKANMVPKLLMFAAAAGMMGGGMKEIMDRVSEYDKTNYLIIPFGLTENGKAVYIRVPQDESSRFLMGTMWKILNMNKQQNFADLFDYFAGQAPTLNPALTMGVETLRYMAGQNPYDYFRQRNVVPEQVFEAGGARSDKAFLKHLWNSAGLGIVYRFPTDDLEKAKSTAEKVIGAPILSNLLGRFVKITNYGKFEELQRIAKGVRQGIARRNLDERDAIVANVNATEKPSVENAFKLYGDMVKAGMLKRKGGLSVVSFSEFRKNYEKFSRRKESDPFVNALIFARGNEERSALLNYYRESMSKEDYEQLIADAVSSGAMTMEPLILSFFEEDKKNAR
jgi:hypothetical protein